MCEIFVSCLFTLESRETAPVRIRGISPAQPGNSSCSVAIPKDVSTNPISEMKASSYGLLISPVIGSHKKFPTDNEGG